MTPDQFARDFDVSRETFDRLKGFACLLIRWNSRINLISPASMNDLWGRHIADSAQLLNLAPPDARQWIDLGSGAGFPGIPVAALAAEKAPHLHLTLVESDARKATFLAEAVRKIGISATIESRRVESMPEQKYDVVSARALAPLDRLCGLAYRFSGPRLGAEVGPGKRTGTVFLFPKGAGLDLELTTAGAGWHIRAERIVSRTDPEATILKILELEPRS